MHNIWRWFKYLWRLRTILDEYIPKINAMLDTINWQQQTIEDLRQSKINLEKEVKKLKEGQETIPIEVLAEEKDKSRITKVNRYYDPQMGVEYFDFEINGEEVSPEDDTVVE